MNLREEFLYAYSQNSVAAETVLVALVVLVVLLPFIELFTAEKHKSAKKREKKKMTSCLC